MQLITLPTYYSLFQLLGIFPFEKLINLSFLDETELPSNQSEWETKLGETPTVEEIKEAKSEYKKRKFKNNAEYLQYYLSLDISILLQSTIKLFEKYYTMLSFHPIDRFTYTIASFSYTAVQAYLASTKRIGVFFVNSPILYNIINEGLIGGTTCVFRNEIDPNNRSRNHKINSHLMENTYFPKRVAYYDITQVGS